MNSNNHKVSIVVPVFNSASFLNRCIQSIVVQTYDNLEIIIIDDCSNDESLSIIKKWASNDKRIKSIVLNENGGAGVARNEGIRIATGQYLAFLDSDDTWFPDKIERQLNFMIEYDYDFTFTDMNVIEPTGNTTIFKSLRSKLSYRNVLRYNQILTSTVILNIGKIGKHFMPEMRNRQDWCLWLDILQHTKYSVRFPFTLTNYYKRKDSISSKKLKLIKFHWKVYRTHLNKSVPLSLILLIQNIANHIILGAVRKS